MPRGTFLARRPVECKSELGSGLCLAGPAPGPLKARVYLCQPAVHEWYEPGTVMGRVWFRALSGPGPSSPPSTNGVMTRVYCDKRFKPVAASGVARAALQACGCGERGVVEIVLEFLPAAVAWNWPLLPLCP